MSVETLYFVRHGETDLNKELRCQGRQRIPLNEAGKKQMQATAELLKGAGVNRIYASPLPRAIQSAEIVAEPLRLEINTLDWLLEIDHGEFEGLNFEEAEKKSAGFLPTWHTKPHLITFPGGESLVNVAERLAKGLSDLTARENGVVCLVTHQVISGVARCIILGKPFSELWEDKLVNGGVYKFELNETVMGRIRNFIVKKI